MPNVHIAKRISTWGTLMIQSSALNMFIATHGLWGISLQPPLRSLSPPQNCWGPHKVSEDSAMFEASTIWQHPPSFLASVRWVISSETMRNYIESKTCLNGWSTGALRRNSRTSPFSPFRIPFHNASCQPFTGRREHKQTKQGSGSGIVQQSCSSNFVLIIWYMYVHKYIYIQDYTSAINKHESCAYLSI